MMNRRKRIFSLLLVTLLCLTLLPGGAGAIITYPESKIKEIKVGEPQNPTRLLAYGDSDLIVYPTTTLPTGITVSTIPLPKIGVGIQGAAGAGTVGGTFFLDLADTADGSGGLLHIVVKKGDQTIVQPDINWRIGDGNFKLDPYSLDMSGKKITGTHVPTYTFSGGDPSIATVDSAGNVTVIGLGSIQVTVSSAGSASYEAATPITFTLTVGDFAIPQAGDNNQLVGWIAALLISTAGLAGLLISNKRRKKAR